MERGNPFGEAADFHVGIHRRCVLFLVLQFLRDTLTMASISIAHSAFVLHSCRVQLMIAPEFLQRRITYASVLVSIVTHLALARDAHAIELKAIVSRFVVDGALRAITEFNRLDLSHFVAVERHIRTGERRVIRGQHRTGRSAEHHAWDGSKP